MTPTHLLLKLSWDRDKPASSNFTLGKRKKSAGAISGTQGRWDIFFLHFATRTPV
jgi:hypothetical protein